MSRKTNNNILSAEFNFTKSHFSAKKWKKKQVNLNQNKRTLENFEKYWERNNKNLSVGINYFIKSNFLTIKWR